jgi:hypothetical protein
MKWKRNYTNRRLEYFQEKYSISQDSIHSFIIPNGISGKTVRQATKRELKHDSKLFERMYALIPDSINSSTGGVDSFYINENKIIYIKQHNLLSNNIHFLK